MVFLIPAVRAEKTRAYHRLMSLHASGVCLPIHNEICSAKPHLVCHPSRWFKG
jgi:hypothetical protein